MKTGAIHHPKLRTLTRLLGMPPYVAVGILESLWQFAGEYAVDGDLSRFPLSEIAEWIGWDDSADALIGALVASRWLDRDEDGLRIHDWEEHCPEFVKKRITRRKTKDLGQGTADNGGQRQTTADNGAVVCLPTPPPIPNPTKPTPEPNPDSFSPEPSPDGEAAVQVGEPDAPSEFAFVVVGKDEPKWHLPQRLLDEYRESYPGVNVAKELREARAWCVSNPTLRKTARGMPRFLNGWLERAQNRAANSVRAGPSRTAAAGPGQTHPEDANRVANGTF